MPQGGRIRTRADVAAILVRRDHHAQATGGTARATATLVERSGAEVAGIVVLMELSFLNGRSVLSGLDVRSLLTV